ncbi:starch-binding protein [Enterococcus gallinarum]|nr:starch-binding protein [Enterococcus gallinarum]
MSDEDLKLGWAMITARAKGTPLFFSRPVGGGNGVRFPEQTKLGDAGSNLYKDPTIVAVNKFHNAMVGQSEYIRNPNGDTNVAMIERGTQGAVIANLSDSEKSLNTETKLANGTYKDQISGKTYTVSNGRLSGSIARRSVLVLTKGDDNLASLSVQGYQEGSHTFLTDTLNLTLQTSNTSEATYSVNNGAPIKFENGKVITIGSQVQFGETVTVTLSAKNAKGETVQSVYRFTKEDPNANTTIRFENPDKWTDVFVYMYNAKGDKLLGAWPGTKMEKDGTGLLAITLPISYETDGVKVLFSNNKGAQYPQSLGFEFKSGGTYSKDGLVAEKPESEFKEENEELPIPFETEYVDNPELKKGQKVTRVEGQDGVKTITYRSEYIGDQLVSKTKISETVSKEPVTQVVEVGTKVPDIEQQIANRVYFNNSQGWSKVYTYVYDNKGVPLVGNWPGKEMSQDEYGYYIELGEEFAGGKVIFNNPDTKVQFPAQNKPGYDLELGQVYEIDGSHRAVLPEPVAEGFTRITFENPGGWSAANVYAYYGNLIQLPLGAWPGQAMLKDSKGHFYIDLQEEYANSNVKLLFNKPNSTIQFPVSVGFDFKVDGHYTKDGLK